MYEKKIGFVPDKTGKKLEDGAGGCISHAAAPTQRCTVFSKLKIGGIARYVITQQMLKKAQPLKLVKSCANGDATCGLQNSF